jgi:glycosyltransferase involved in cell wall biosynthesis
MANRARREIWFHALGAKVGGGITYLRAVVPEIVRQLDGRDVRVVLLLPAPVEGLELPDWIEPRYLGVAASNALTRLAFDQVVLPLWLAARRGAVLYCSGSFSPLVQTAPTVALLRNAIYFDDDYLALETARRRAIYRAQGALAIAGARRCAATVYPSRSMRDLVAARAPDLAERGVVDSYGVSDVFAEAGRDRPAPGVERGPTTFLYVMTYTLQKNFGYLLRALALARADALPVRVVVTTTLDAGAPASFERDRAFIDEHDLVGSGYLAPVGPKFGRDLVDLYRSSDACVFPSICESFGHPLVEAMTMGLPIVCSDRPYARELCGEGATYVDPNRPEDLVEVWREWPAAAERTAPVPLDAVLGRFSWRDHVARLLDVLLETHD